MASGHPGATPSPQPRVEEEGLFTVNSYASLSSAGSDPSSQPIFVARKLSSLRQYVSVHGPKLSHEESFPAQVTPPSRTSSGHDSGYSSPGSSFGGLKPLDKPVPDALKDRFFDFQMCYSQQLWRAISKKSRGPGDLSMKLKYLVGHKDSTERLYIVVHCEKKVAKKVKKFFAQKNVREDLGSDFDVHIIDSGLLRLSDEKGEHVKVTGRLEGMETFCGAPITLERGYLAASSTIGGLVMVTAGVQQTLYGITAGHPLLTFLDDHDASDSESDIDSDFDEYSDTDDATDASGQQPVDEKRTTINDAPLNSAFSQVMSDIGTIFADSVEKSDSRAADHDWALVELETDKWLPNLSISYSCFSQNSRPDLVKQSVCILAPSGRKRGTLDSNKSVLMMAPGTEFVEIFDFCPEEDSRVYPLHPGDSGSWVVDEFTGEVYGHVVSVDAFGEACVMPIQSTLKDIRERLQAEDVTIPLCEEIAYLHYMQKGSALPEAFDLVTQPNYEHQGATSHLQRLGDACRSLSPVREQHREDIISPVQAPGEPWVTCFRPMPAKPSVTESGEISGITVFSLDPSTSAKKTLQDATGWRKWKRLAYEQLRQVLSTDTEDEEPADAFPDDWKTVQDAIGRILAENHAPNAATYQSVPSVLDQLFPSEIATVDTVVSHTSSSTGHCGKPLLYEHVDSGYSTAASSALATPDRSLLPVKKPEPNRK